jgi:hypothetical protein
VSTHTEERERAWTKFAASALVAQSLITIQQAKANGTFPWLDASFAATVADQLLEQWDRRFPTPYIPTTEEDPSTKSGGESNPLISKRSAWESEYTGKKR